MNTSPAPSRTVAAFDFDGTLSRRDSLGPFLAETVGVRRLALAVAADCPRLVASALGRGDRDAAKERLLVRLLAGTPVARLEESGRDYARRLVASGLRRDVRHRLEWHRAQGHELAIVSASLGVYLREVARLLEVDVLLCTELEVDRDGLCTGRISGGNCRGVAKAERLRAHIGDATCALWAYGDSAGDREMLAMADHAVRIGRRPHLTVTP